MPPAREEPPLGRRVTRKDLEQEILGERPSLTVDDVVADGKVSIELARQFWRALGFPEARGARAFTAADVAALQLLTGLVDDNELDLATAVKLTRAVGHTLARLADWQVATLSEYIEDMEHAGHGTGSRLQTGLAVLRALEPKFEQLLLYAWRRHLAVAVGRIEALGAEDSDLHTLVVTVGFADLVSFTNLSNGIDGPRLAGLVEDFESACADLVTAGGGRVIKTLGDSVLFIAGGPRAGIDIACDIVEHIGGDPLMPDVHVGIATGPVVMRLGDVFGAPVNLASRLTGIARRNRVICDPLTAAAVADVKGYAARSMTERDIRGFGMIEPISIRRLS
jgi:adenylate cyclase